MKIPKRLPKRLEEYVKHVELGGAKMLASSMWRARGRMFIDLTFVQTYTFTDPTLITVDFCRSYDPYKRTFKDVLSAHRRNFDVFRKAVLAS